MRASSQVVLVNAWSLRLAVLVLLACGTSGSGRRIQIELIPAEGSPPDAVIQRRRLHLTDITSLLTLTEKIANTFGVSVRDIRLTDGQQLSDLHQLQHATKLLVHCTAGQHSTRHSEAKPTTSKVRALYEALPYPPPEPGYRALTYSKEQTDLQRTGFDIVRVNSRFFGGNLQLRDPQGQPFRVLFAGGGTGVPTTEMVQHLTDLGCVRCQVVHLDLSAASIDYAKGMLAARKLHSTSSIDVRFVQGSMLDAPLMKTLGLFDWINCVGVLHHLEKPVEGLQALSNVLAPSGGLSVMLYGKYGRTNVYHAQANLRQLLQAQGLQDQPHSEEAIAVARQYVKAANWRSVFFEGPENERANFYNESDAWQGMHDAAFADLLLHPKDHGFTVDMIAELISDAQLQLVSFDDPKIYEPAGWIQDDHLLTLIQKMPQLARASFMERHHRTLVQHCFHLTKLGRPLPTPPDCAAKHSVMVMPFWVLYKLKEKRQWRDPSGRFLTFGVRKHGVFLMAIIKTFFGEQVAPMIDSKRTNFELFTACDACRAAGWDWEKFAEEMCEFDEQLGLRGINIVTLTQTTSLEHINPRHY